MATPKAIFTLSMLALPLGASCKCGKCGGDTGMDCQVSDLTVGADTSTWPDGLETAVVAFEALEGSWTTTLTCQSGHADADITVTLTPGPRADLYLMAPVEGRDDSCDRLAQGTATVVLAGLTDADQTGTVSAAYSAAGETYLSGTLGGDINIGINAFSASLQYSSFDSADGGFSCRTDDTLYSWTKVDTKTK